MKIERLNENQIRCTLTRADLAARQLKISELAYGSEKARMLFRDMMQQASFDLGFETENFPLMIEAIPAPADTIVLIITKVSEPEEMDTRFSKFTSAQEGPASSVKLRAESEDDSLRLFTFQGLDEAIEAVSVLPPLSCDDTKLFADEKNGQFFLLIRNEEMKDEEFAYVCHVLSEYGAALPARKETLSYLNEQYRLIFDDQSVRRLTELAAD